jgi:ribosomal protein S7
MPYGFPKALGGDNAQNDAKMERCVQHVMETQGKSKASAIRICKVALERAAEKT